MPNNLLVEETDPVDKPAPEASIKTMKPSFLLILGFALGAGAALAQQGTQGSAPDTKPSGLSANENLQAYLQRNSTPVKQPAPVTPNLQVSGPLVEPFKAKQGSSTPKQLLQLVNPFAPVPPQPAPETRTRGISTRAWTSVVGWSPGSSAFPDAVTHEPHMSLVSVSGRSHQ